MDQASEEFWDRYRTLVGRLMRPLGKSDGYSEKMVSVSEKQLGFRLPALLREFYLIAGKREDINSVFERLGPPAEIYMTGEMLVFYEENQNVYLWGISQSDLDKDDPPVFRAENTPELTWEPDSDHLSEFLVGMLFMQAVNGGMRHSGIGYANGVKIAQVSADWEVVNIGGDWNNKVLMQYGQVLFIIGQETDPQVFGGARTKRAFMALEKAFGVNWDYCTLDDE